MVSRQTEGARQAERRTNMGSKKEKGRGGSEGPLPWRASRQSSHFKISGRACLSLLVSRFSAPFFSALLSVLFGSSTARATFCCVHFTNVNEDRRGALLDSQPLFASWPHASLSYFSWFLRIQNSFLGPRSGHIRTTSGGDVEVTSNNVLRRSAQRFP